MNEGILFVKIPKPQGRVNLTEQGWVNLTERYRYRMFHFDWSAKPAINKSKLEKVGALLIEVLESPRPKVNKLALYYMLWSPVSGIIALKAIFLLT